MTRLAEIRKQKGFSQSQLAEASSVAVRNIRSYEQDKKGINKANAANVYLLSKALGCNMEDLVETDEIEAPESMLPCIPLKYWEKEDLIKRYSRGDEFKFIFFWSEKAANGYLSQWWKSNFTVDGLTYNCAEQYMMAEKARLFPGNDNVLEEIMQTTDPKKHKALGRKVKNYDDKVWAKARKDIVRKGNYAKFSQNPDLLELLKKTKGHVLVEASPYDKIWGIGMKENTPGIEKPYNWQGENLLGFAIMEVRDIIFG